MSHTPIRTRVECTYCGGNEFIFGPRGGLGVNICCANRTCRHWFFTSPLGHMEDIDRVEDADSPIFRATAEYLLPAAVRAEPPLVKDIIAPHRHKQGADLVRDIIAMLPDDKALALDILDATRRLVERFKRGRRPDHPMAQPWSDDDTP